MHRPLSSNARECFCKSSRYARPTWPRPYLLGKGISHLRLDPRLVLAWDDLHLADGEPPHRAHGPFDGHLFQRLDVDPPPLPRLGKGRKLLQCGPLVDVDHVPRFKLDFDRFLVDLATRGAGLLDHDLVEMPLFLRITEGLLSLVPPEHFPPDNRHGFRLEPILKPSRRCYRSEPLPNLRVDPLL